MLISMKVGRKFPQSIFDLFDDSSPPNFCKSERKRNSVWFSLSKPSALLCLRQIYVDFFKMEMRERQKMEYLFFIRVDLTALSLFLFFKKKLSKLHF